MTLSYDSDKRSTDPMFRDAQPDDYYLVYGDSSTRGFDAQSTSRMYVRFDRGRTTYCMATTIPVTARMRPEFCRTSIAALPASAYTSRTRSSSTRRLPPATACTVCGGDSRNGTSGPYLVSRMDWCRIRRRLNCLCATAITCADRERYPPDIAERLRVQRSYRRDHLQAAGP